jgi:hypothetical protein
MDEVQKNVFTEHKQNAKSCAGCSLLIYNVEDLLSDTTLLSNLWLYCW